MSDIPGVVTRHFEWAEWDMMIQKDDVSEIYVPGVCHVLEMICNYEHKLLVYNHLIFSDIITVLL